MSDDRFYCRSGSKFFALCLLLISSVFFSWSAWDGDFCMSSKESGLFLR